MEQPLWQPKRDDISQCQLFQFVRYINLQYQQQLCHYTDLHRWSIEHNEAFWQALWNFSNIIASNEPTTIKQTTSIPEKTQWFLGATLNYAENLLTHPADQIAIEYQTEAGHQQTLSYGQLQQKVNNVAAYLLSIGLQAGDTVTGIMSNNPHTIIAMLACSSIGVIWSSCSPELGFNSCLERLQQVKPKLILAQLEHQYNGKSYNHSEKIQQLAQAIAPPHWILIDNTQQLSITKPYSSCIDYDKIPKSDQAISYTQLPFDHPLVILFTSGTTGAPKCLVHGAGGTLLQHIKEHRLHTDLRSEEKIFFYTTTSWMMWNWLVSGLATGATLVLYDGAPTYPKTHRLLSLIEQYEIHYFGIGAKLVETWQHKKTSPKDRYDFSSLKTLLSTGSALLPDAYDYLQQHVKPNLQIASISGGTDIISCFALGNPMMPVYKGQLQSLGLGMDVQVFSEEGQAIIDQEGELVCCNNFPSRPLYFLNDTDGSRYHQAYYNQFDNVWTHGDFAILHQQGSLSILGRSDTTLNPGGIRIGTADIYRETNKIDIVTDAIAVGKKYNGDEKIVLLVILNNDLTLNEDLKIKIKQMIRQGTTAFHTPKYIFQVTDLPRTVSGKLCEKAVKKIINRQPINNQSAIANPECLAQLYQLAEKIQ